MNRFIILLLAALMLPICESLQAQRREDFPNITSGNKIFGMNFTVNVWATSQVTVQIYSDRTGYRCDEGYSMEVKIKHSKGDYGLCFFSRLYWATFREAFWDKISANTPEHDIYNRLFNCDRGVSLRINDYTEIDAELFRGMSSLEELDLGWQMQTIRKGAFRDCGNLKFVKIGPNLKQIEQDVFLACPDLQAIEFEGAPISGSNLKHMFNTNYQNTGSWYYPDFRTFVVPDNHVDGWRNTLSEACQSIADGWVRIMPRSEFYTPRATGVTLNVSSATLRGRGSTCQLTATVNPSGASDRTVRWSSSNSGVATVSSSGLVTYVSPGTATITATSNEGGFTATCHITAVTFVTGVTLNASSVKLRSPGSTHQLTATVNASGAHDGTVTWSSSNPGVATVSSSGLVTYVSLGTADITATSNEGGLTATCGVTCITGVTGVTLNGSDTTLIVGQSFTVPYNVIPADATDKSVTWRSSNSGVATVSDAGLVTAIDGGTANITVTTVDVAFSATRTVTVVVPVTGITLNKTVWEMITDDTGWLTATIAPSNATNKTVTWSSSNTAVVAVERGWVTAIGSGTAVITVTTDYSAVPGPFTASCTVTVKNKDATLQSLAISDVTLSPPFNPDISSYIDTVPNSTDRITVTAVRNDMHATVTGDDDRPLEVGNNTVDITVTAENGDQKDYTVSIYRLSNDAIMDTLSPKNEHSFLAMSMDTVPLNVLSPPFNPYIFSYTLTVPHSVENMTFIGKARDEKSVISGDINKSKILVFGDNLFNIIVTAEDGTEQVYTISVHRLSNDATLSALTVASTDPEATYALSPAFNSTNLSYSVSVPDSVPVIAITAETGYHLASVTGAGDKSLITVDSTFNITVNAEDGTPNTYTVSIHRLSHDATLRYLAVSNATLFPEFNPDILIYTDTVPNSTGRVAVTAEQNHDSATVTVERDRSLIVGDNTVDITVTAEDGTQKVYTVSIHRLSNDATLKSLTINNGAVPLSFYSHVFEYGVEVDVPDITIDCKATNKEATVLNAGAKSLNPGENVFTVTVNAEDYPTTGTTETYTITVYRLSNDATLKYLTVAPAELEPPFSPDITQYTANVPHSVSSIAMDFGVNYPLAALWTGPGLEQPGIKQLNAGENIFGVSVYAENKKYYKSYWVRVTREAPPSPTPDPPTGFYEAGTPAAVHVYTVNGRLHVSSSAAERINVYSVTGRLLYSFDKPAGAFTLSRLRTFALSPFLIVKGSSGWVKKLVVSD